MSENPYEPPKEVEKKQEFFGWQLPDPWWSLAWGITISAFYFGGVSALLYVCWVLTTRFGPFGD